MTRAGGRRMGGGQEDGREAGGCAGGRMTRAGGRRMRGQRKAKGQQRFRVFGPGFRFRV